MTTGLHDSIPPNALSETAARAALFELLEHARRVLDHAPADAKALIERASELLRGGNGNRSGLHFNDHAKGGLAAWQIGRVKAYIEANLSSAMARSRRNLMISSDIASALQSGFEA